VGKKLPTLPFYIDTIKQAHKLKLQILAAGFEVYKRKIDSLFSKLLSALI
jgi:hypothetical protein